MLESYFVCLYKTAGSTLIEYGKTVGTSNENGDVYLMFHDSDDHMKVRFYGFSNRNEPVDIFHISMKPRNQMNLECSGGTHKDFETQLCVPRCHTFCDPLEGNLDLF